MCDLVSSRLLLCPQAPRLTHLSVLCRPVDYVAEGIAGVASAQRRGIGLYHMVNPHWDDDVSLDSFLGWIQNAGYTLQRIPNYAQWYGAILGITSCRRGSVQDCLWAHNMTPQLSTMQDDMHGGSP